MNRLTISEAANQLGVSISTLRRWEKEGKIESYKTDGGHRRYDIGEILNVQRDIAQSDRKTICYARVSSFDQKDDLKRQIALLEKYCACNGWTFEIIDDLGSGLNYTKKGLKKLIREICSGTVDRLVVTNKDRLLRFGSEIIFSLCEQFNTQVIIINSSETSSYEDTLVEDVLEIITVFSARLYGSRSHKNKKFVEALQEACNDLSKC